jgi:hypothetical protein
VEGRETGQQQEYTGLVAAAFVQFGQYRKIGIGEKPTFGAFAGNKGRGERTQVFFLRYGAKVLAANTCQINDFLLGEELLAKPNPDHDGLPPMTTLARKELNGEVRLGQWRSRTSSAIFR